MELGLIGHGVPCPYGLMGLGLIGHGVPCPYGLMGSGLVGHGVPCPYGLMGIGPDRARRAVSPRVGPNWSPTVDALFHQEGPDTRNLVQYLTAHGFGQV